jgi:hypothetical protein
VQQQWRRRAEHLRRGRRIINAVQNATGARIRDFSATSDKSPGALDALDG